MPALSLIVMTRLPAEGFVKTRLIPALGAIGAMDFHGRLARHCISRAASFCSAGQGRKMTICFTGGTTTEAKCWLADGEFHFRQQADGDLGERMRIAAGEEFAAGAEKVLIVGTDCPEMDQAALEEAASSLGKHDLVFGPALDGGYYLIGMAKLEPAVFQGISWGTELVLPQSCEAARKAGLTFHLLSPLPDVDVPEDIPGAKAALENR
ncbi:TIGR04282 family arsenosugar biosynthesis glycosyltransferase [Akkermansiaceae bacterium]|nr:TIGR04282 family arsenosugar biosynthesis glycosyltransferase [Akkermansiaceae bacterium]